MCACACVRLRARVYLRVAHSPEEVQKLRKDLPQETTLIVDEAYIDFSAHNALCVRLPNTVCVCLRPCVCMRPFGFLHAGAPADTLLQHHLATPSCDSLLRGNPDTLVRGSLVVASVPQATADANGPLTVVTVAGPGAHTVQGVWPGRAARGIRRRRRILDQQSGPD